MFGTASRMCGGGERRLGRGGSGCEVVGLYGVSAAQSVGSPMYPVRNFVH